MQEYEAHPGVESTPAVVNLLHSISPLGIPGTPTAPIYDYHSAVDELAQIGPDRQLIRRFCAGGVKVDHVETLLGEHVAVAVTGAPGAVAYRLGAGSAQACPARRAAAPVGADGGHGDLRADALPKRALQAATVGQQDLHGVRSSLRVRR